MKVIARYNMNFFMYVYLTIIRHTWSKCISVINKLFMKNSKINEGYQVLNRLKECKTPKDLEYLYRELDFKYKSDILDYASKPEVTCYNRGGDCDDFAELSYNILKEHHYNNVYKVYMFKKMSGHVVTIIDNSYFNYHMMNNMYCITYKGILHDFIMNFGMVGGVDSYIIVKN